MQLGLKAEFELVPKSEQRSFAVREFKLAAFASPWHFHPEIELTYILQSEGRRFVGDHIAPFGPGDLVLVGSNLPHFWHNEPPAAAQPYAHSIVVQFRPQCFGPGFFSMPELAGVQGLLRASARGLQFTGNTRDAVAAIVLEMGKHGGLEQLIDFLEIFKELAQAEEAQPLSSAGFVPTLDHRASERINRAYEHVFAHFTERLEYEVIARESGMSLSAFCHYFKRVTGRTLSALVAEVRVGNARRLLIETPETIAEIAYASGFETLSNFNRQFRELTDMSPREYRSQFQPKHARAGAAGPSDDRV